MVDVEQQAFDPLPSFELLAASSMQRLQRAYPNLAVGRVLDIRVTAYREPHRYYHNLQHLAECLVRFEQVQHLLHDAPAVELALWFHDAVYQTQPKLSCAAQKLDSNEVQSAALFRQLCQQALSTHDIHKISALILATEQHAATTDADLQYLLDIDLTILAATPSRFSEYEQQIRAEYAWVDAAVYEQKRREVLAEFLQRQPLYQTRYFQQQLTQEAQYNLQNAVRL